jgi:hypothetical protein
MNRKPVVQVPEVPGIDLDYRPRNYFLAADLKIPLLSGIAGETRRQMVRAFVEAGSTVPAGLVGGEFSVKRRSGAETDRDNAAAKRNNQARREQGMMRRRVARA